MKKEYARCLLCARPLKAMKSRLKGYGPTCIKNPEAVHPDQLTIEDILNPQEPASHLQFAGSFATAEEIAEASAFLMNKLHIPEAAAADIIRAAMLQKPPV